MGKYARSLADEENCFSHDSSDNEGLSKVSRFKQYLRTDVDPTQSSVPLAAYCFMTGFVDSVTFTAVSVWCGFQTGNTIEMALGLARLFATAEVPGNSFRVVDRQALTSLIAFLSGAFLARIGDHMGCRTRIWLFFGTMLQALFTMAAALFLWKGGQSSFSTTAPTWTNIEGFSAIAFTSASMGLQGIMGKRVNTEFATTIVLTSVWCELMADPRLFKLRFVKSRDLKVVAVVSLFVGGVLGRTFLGKIGSANTFFIGTIIRAFIALWWLIVPGENRVEEGKEGKERADVEKGADVEEGKEAEGKEADKGKEVEMGNEIEKGEGIKKSS